MIERTTNIFNEKQQLTAAYAEHLKLQWQCIALQWQAMNDAPFLLTSLAYNNANASIIHEDVASLLAMTPLLEHVE